MDGFAKKPDKAPDPLRPGPSKDHIEVGGIALRWNTQAGTCTFQGLPVAMLWVDTTLAGLMSGVATMVGAERFSLALQSEGRKSVESDWQLISNYPDFRSGFEAIAVVAAVAGWGIWQLAEDEPAKRECRFRGYNTWEGMYQRSLGTCWGSAMLAGKLAGYCSRRFGTNCWATQTSFIAKGDRYDEFIVAPSSRLIEDELDRLLGSDLSTRADMAVALTRLQEVKAQLLRQQESLEQQVRERTAELAASTEQLRKEVAEHSRSQAARRESEQLLHRIIELAPMSMAIVAMDGTIEYINRKAIETFGYQPEDIPNMDRWWAQAYPDPEYRREVAARWMGYVGEAIAERREIRRDDYRITCKDGSVKTCAVFGVPVADKVFVMFDDITLPKLREELLKQSNLELERRVEERTAELAERNRSLQAEIVERRQAEERLVQANATLERTTAHLRKLGAKLARVEEHERKRMAHILHDQLQQMLVAASFGLSALEKGLTEASQHSTARATRQALDEAIRESKSLVLELSPPILREGGLAPAIHWACRWMHEKHGLKVVTSLDERVQTIGEDLRVAIFHSVRELLLNIVKHAGVNTAQVTVRIRPDMQVEVVVSDNGRGYSPDATAPKDDLDLGFGLMAVRERFEALGGGMTIESAPGQGCRVTLLAPIHMPVPTEPHGVGATPAAPDLKEPTGVAGQAPVPAGVRIRVLLVDDHVMLRQGLAELLSRDPSIEVVGTASDGEAAVHQARILHPEIILMDVSMPRMNGIEATRIIRAELPHTSVIGLSMYAESHRAEEMRQAGACAYVSKSEAAEALAATIHACCGR